MQQMQSSTRLFLALLMSTQAAALINSPRTKTPTRLVLRRRAVIMVDPPEADKDKADEDEGAALAAAFQQRLNEEGGAEMFKLKSDASRVGSNIQETTSSLVQGAKDAGNKILDVVCRCAQPRLHKPFPHPPRSAHLHALPSTT